MTPPQKRMIRLEKYDPETLLPKFGKQRSLGKQEDVLRKTKMV